MDKKETNKEISLLESIKVIFITLVAMLIPSVLVGFLLQFIFSLNVIVGSVIGFIVVIILIFALGLHKPATANEYNEDEDEDDDD